MKLPLIYEINPHSITGEILIRENQSRVEGELNQVIAVTSGLNQEENAKIIVDCVNAFAENNKTLTMKQHEEKMAQTLFTLTSKGLAIAKFGFGEYLVFSLFKDVMLEEVEVLLNSDDWSAEHVHVTIYHVALVKITYLG